MDIISLADGIDLIHLPNLSYLILAFVIIYIGQLVEGVFANNKREKIISHERELYYRRLMDESLSMERDKLKEELQLAQSIENLRCEGDEVRSQLDEDILDDSDWSADESDSKSAGEVSSMNAPENSKFEQKNKELADLQNKVDELKSLDVERHQAIHELNENNDKSAQVSILSVDYQEQTEELSARIKQLEAENNELKSQLVNYNDILEANNQKLAAAATDIDPEVLSYLEAHSDDLTLSFLEQAHTTLIDLRTSDPDKDFYEYIEELKHSHSNHATELAELKVAKKEAEIKMQLMKRRFDEELNSFNELKVEHIFKNSGAKEYIERVKQTNKEKEELIGLLKKELEQKRSDLVVWQSKFREAEEQCNVYWKAWKDTQVRKEQLEAERKVKMNNDPRFFGDSMNFSSRSSISNESQIPPPPPIDVPTVDEILSLTDS